MLNLVFIGGTVLLGFIIYFILSRKKTLSLPLPPGPKGLPILGNYFNLPPPGTLEYEHWYKLKEDYGPISSVSILGQAIILVHDKEAIHELFEKNSIKTSSRVRSPFGSDMCGFGKLLLSKQYDDDFKSQRRMMHQHLGTKALASRHSKTQDIESRRFLLRTLEDPANLFDHIRREAAAIILKITYGYTIEPFGKDPMVSKIEYMMHCLTHVMLPMSWMVDVFPALRHLPKGFPGAGGFQETAEQCHKIIDTIANTLYDFSYKKMTQGNDSSSFVSATVQTCTRNGQSLSKVDEENIKLAATIMYGGGADTTVSTVLTAVLAMVLNPDIQKKAQKEIDQVLGVNALPRLEDRERLPYVSALIRESSRFIPVAPLGLCHVSSEELTYKNYRIPKGSYIIPQSWWFLHDPATYADPESFTPERFLPPRNEPDPSTHVFGYGRRVCPGGYLAEDSLFMMISRILAFFNINKAKDEQGKGRARQRD